MDGSIAPLLVTTAAGAVSIAALLWAMRVTDGARGAIAQFRQKSAELEDKLARADSVFAAHPGVVLIWEEAAGPAEDGDWGKPRAYGSPLALASMLRFSNGSAAGDPAVRILHGLSSFEAKDPQGASIRLSTALAKLRREGAPFSLRIATTDGVFIEVDGRTAGARAVLWILDASVKGVEQSGGQGRVADADALSVIARDPTAFLEMMQQAPFFAWRLSGGLKLEWANDHYVEALEAKSLDKAVARNLLLDQCAADQARRVQESGERIEELRFIPIGGQRRALRMVAFRVAGGVGGMAFDVTDAENAQDALTRHVKAHDETLNHLNEGVAVFGPDKRLIFFNRAFQEMWGLDAAFLNDRPSHGQWLDQLKDMRRLPAHANYAEWRAAELALYQEVADLPVEPWVLQGGRTIRIARQRHPMGGLLLVFSDLTNELTLRSQYNHLLQTQRAAMDKLYEGVVVFGLDGRLKLVNAAFTQLWGLDPAMLEGDMDYAKLVDLCLPRFHDRAVWQQLKARISDPSPSARQEFRGEMKRSDESILTFLTRPLPDGDTLIAFLDVTATRRVEAALRDRAEAFEAADRLKTDFVQNVSVQLRDPLQTIQGYSQMLAQRLFGPLNDRQQEQIDTVVSASENLKKLVDNILDLAMIEANALDLELGDVDLAAAVKDSVAMAKGSAKDADVKISVSYDAKIGLIRADEKRVRQMLFNLLTHALRATKPGDEIKLGARRMDNAVLISVQDTGAGMSHADQAAAFDPFRSFDKEGAGLALTLVRSFAELHGGWVKLNSEPGEGTTIEVFLPTSVKVAAAA